MNDIDVMPSASAPTTWVDGSSPGTISVARRARRAPVDLDGARRSCLPMTGVRWRLPMLIAWEAPLGLVVGRGPLLCLVINPRLRRAWR